MRHRRKEKLLKILILCAVFITIVMWSSEEEKFDQNKPLEEDISWIHETVNRDTNYAVVSTTYRQAESTSHSDSTTETAVVVTTPVPKNAPDANDDRDETEKRLHLAKRLQHSPTENIPKDMIPPFKFGPDFGDPYSGISLQNFARALSIDEYRLMQTTIAALHSALGERNLTYFMAAGTLLGSYRHHGIVPWDDDLDIYILYSEKELVQAALTDLAPDFYLFTQSTRWKFFSFESKPIATQMWSFPFVDICFIDDFKGLLADADPAFASRFHYTRNDIFPLRLRPFGRLMLWSPNNVERVLNISYKLEICTSSAYNHRHEVWTRATTTVPCAMLRDTCAFVRRRKVEGGSEEDLEKDGSTFSKHFEPDPV
jgi:hypothetical protein